MTIRWPVLISLLTGFYIPINAQVSQTDTLNLRKYEVYLGSAPNIESGSKTVLSATSLLFDQLNYPISKIENKVLAPVARILNLSLVQLYLGGLLYGTINHEVFGHLSRAKEVGINPRLKLNFPGLGADYLFRVPHSVDPLERLRIVAGGPEASIVIAHQATQRLYDNERPAHYTGNFLLSAKLFDGLLYIQNEIKPFLSNPNDYYAANSSFFARNPVPNDPLAYILALTESYGFYDHFVDTQEIWLAPQSDMTVYTDNEFIHDQYKRLKRAFTLSVLDPALFSFIQGTFSYLITGQRSIRPAMLRFKKFRLMPAIRATYGELGAENYFDVHVKHDHLPPFSVYYRHGGNLFHNIAGAGIEIRALQHKKSIIDGQIDFWRNQRDQKFNFHIYTKLSRQIPNTAFYITMAAGYKTRGLLIGKPYRNGIYGYIGGIIALSN